MNHRLAADRRRRKKIFLTGMTGGWGRHVLRELARREDRFDIVALVRPTRDERRAAVALLSETPNLHVVFGDLRDARVVANCVQGADYVLHLGGLVSPLADRHPELVHDVNVGSARNIIRAVRSQPDPSAIGVVMIGSVAQTGDRNPPHHWGRVGDPLLVSRFDEYGQSKVTAERLLVDSGLPKWVWLRQTGILHPGMLQIRDPIVTHTPLDGAMEWVSVEDASRLVANLCEDDCPEEVWGGVYNIGGGEACRVTNWDLLDRVARVLGVPDARSWYDRRWFATRNFHGHWFSDSDRLEQLVPFRRDSFDDALTRAVASTPLLKLARHVPGWLIRRFVFEPLTRRARGTMAYIHANDEDGIATWFGSRQRWEALGDWSTFTPTTPDRTPRFFDHGYDESIAPSRWSTRDLDRAATFRGGSLLSHPASGSDVTSPLTWRCAFGHVFTGSPRLVLSFGHWCPECVRDPATYARQAERSPFFAQLSETTATQREVSPIARVELSHATRVPEGDHPTVATQEAP